jgi:hypothetical protein
VTGAWNNGTALTGSGPHTKKFKIIVNGVAVDSAAVTASLTRKACESLSPTSVSPVLHTKVTITLTSAYTGTLVIADTTVELHGTDKKGKATMRKMYITAVNNTGKRTI